MPEITVNASQLVHLAVRSDPTLEETHHHAPAKRKILGILELANNYSYFKKQNTVSVMCWPLLLAVYLCLCGVAAETKGAKMVRVC